MIAHNKKAVLSLDACAREAWLCQELGFAGLQAVAYGTGVSLRAQIVLLVVSSLAAMGATSKDAVKPESRKTVTTATATDRAAHTNRLAREKSPYLLQHQHNPVDRKSVV